MSVMQQTRHVISTDEGSVSLEIYQIKGDRWFSVQVTHYDQTSDTPQAVSIDARGPLDDLLDLLRAEGIEVDDGARSAKAYNDGQVRALDDLAQQFADKRPEQRIGIGTLRGLIDDAIEDIR